jgi:hypothetical protein
MVYLFSTSRVMEIRNGKLRVTWGRKTVRPLVSDSGKAGCRNSSQLISGLVCLRFFFDWSESVRHNRGLEHKVPGRKAGNAQIA